MKLMFVHADLYTCVHVHACTCTCAPPLSLFHTLLDELNETKDTIEVNGEVFHKPFVEKPLSAEDHNVHIYFPSDYGGGCQTLFRKVSFTLPFPNCVWLACALHS